MDHSFRLAERDWADEIERGLSEPSQGLYIVSPFIKVASARRLLKRRNAASLRIVTRYNLNDFDCGASDTEALEVLLGVGAEIRGLKGLHSKLYVFGNHRCIVTSANFTESGLLRNREFGFISTEEAVVSECRSYCERLWNAGRENLNASDLQSWLEILKQARLSRRPIAEQRLPDFGQPPSVPDRVPVGGGIPQSSAFIKFFGSADSRALRSMTILEDVVSSGSHWACTYPKRPRQPNDGDRMFMARMVRSPNDYMIYGEAIGRRHVDDQDVASPADLQLREWKRDWPYYIRVHRPRFLERFPIILVRSRTS